ncbi:MAG TPA: 2-phospho-L-lactate guanylyltransferase [Thermoleophilaceae bacterium]
MRTLAIVPVKTFGDAKQRLAAALARGSRRSLAQAMFCDVLAALGRAGRVDRIAVVTHDTAAESLAHGRAIVLRDESPAGQSAAAAIGIRHALASEFDRVLLVPGDTPLLDPEEVDRLLDRTERDGIAVGIVADRHGTGTNALALAPPDAIEPAFGPGSLERHVRSAEAAGAAHRLELAESLAHDVDTPADLRAMLARIESVRGRGQRTRGALHQLDRSGALAALSSGGSRSGHPLEV